MLFVYLCEDEEPERLRLEKLIHNTITIDELDMRLVKAASAPDELLSALTEATMPGLYFLDIDLACAMNGLELALEIRKRDPRGFIVFVTAKGELAPLAFRYKVEALDYICKDDMAELPDRMRHCIHTAWQRYASPKNHVHDTITLKVQGTLFAYPRQEILFIEMAGQPHKIRLHTKNKIVEIPISLKEIENQLGDGFLRCHKSCIINRTHIRQVDKQSGRIFLDTGASCPCSTRYVKKLISSLQKID